MQLFASVRPRAGGVRRTLRAQAGHRTTALRIALVAALATLLLAGGALGATSAPAASPPGAIRGDHAPRQGTSALEIGAWCLAGVVVLGWLASDRGTLSRRRKR